MTRFYLADPDALVLHGAEAHHAAHVLRLPAGADIELFDGLGHVVKCRIVKLDRDAIRLTALERASTPPLPCRITLATAILKKNMDFIVQKATELGVAAIVPLVTERTVVRVAGDAAKAVRWREIALDSCKQCGNNWLPEIRQPQSLAEWLASAVAADLKLVAALQTDAAPLKLILPAGPVRSVAVLVGPEGDFSPAEYAAVRTAGFRPLTLGPLVLRADTAALYALSVVHHELVVHR